MIWNVMEALEEKLMLWAVTPTKQWLMISFQTSVHSLDQSGIMRLWVP